MSTTDVPAPGIRWEQTAEPAHRFSWWAATATGHVSGTARSYSAAVRARRAVVEALADVAA